MKSGINNLTLLAVDISGNPALGLLNASWTTEGQIGGSLLDSATVTEVSGGDGFYSAAMTLPAGQGYVFLRNTDPLIYVTPDYFDLDVDSHDTDDVYGKLVATGTSNLPTSSPARYSIISLNCKQDSDIVETIQVPTRYLPLTGYTNMTVQCFPAAKLLDSATPPITGSYTATVLSEVDGTVDIHIGDDVIGNVIPQGSSSVVIYGDLKYFDANGNERRPVELQITVRRDFNNNN